MMTKAQILLLLLYHGNENVFSQSNGYNPSSEDAGMSALPRQGVHQGPANGSLGGKCTSLAPTSTSGIREERPAWIQILSLTIRISTNSSMLVLTQASGQMESWPWIESFSGCQKPPLLPSCYRHLLKRSVEVLSAAQHCSCQCQGCQAHFIGQVE